MDEKEEIQVFEDALNLKEPWVATDGEYFARGATEENARRALKLLREMHQLRQTGTTYTWRNDEQG